MGDIIELEDKIWHIKRLTKDDKICDFCSGDQDMDDFINHRAHLFSEQRLSVNYVLITNEDQENPVGFFTLSCDRICMSDFYSKSEFNRFRKKRFKNSKRLKGFPAIKIGRIAVSSDLQGFGLGALLIEAIKDFICSVKYVGCRFITVDAYLTKVDLYKKFGFDVLCHEEVNSDSHTCEMYYDLLTMNN